MKNWGWGILVGAISCAALGGCALQTGESTDGTELVASTGDALIGGWASGPFQWAQGQPALALESANTHVCVLSGVSGHFAGTGEMVKVTIGANNTWVLDGFSQQSGVSGEALCFPKAGFTGNSSAHLNSDEAIAGAFSRGKHSPGGGCQQGQAALGVGSDFAFVEGMQGEMAGAGEFSAALQSPSQNTESLLRAQICTAGIYQTFGRFLRVNRVFTMPAQFVGSGGLTGDVNAVPEFSIGGNLASDGVVMAPTDRAMCALTEVTGKFFGGGESVRIRAAGSVWVMMTAKGAGSNFVAAKARCFARNQLNP